MHDGLILCDIPFRSPKQYFVTVNIKHMVRKHKETILPQIRLKYFTFPAPNEKHSDLQCSYCGKIGITVGAGDFRIKNDPKFVCQDCAVDAFMTSNGYTDRKVATARRRRIFDIGYLLTEIIIDKFLEDHNMSSEKKLSGEEWNGLCKLGGYVYNEFSKEEKLELEQIADQQEIERRLRGYLTRRTRKAWEDD